MKRIALALGLCLILQHAGPAADPAPAVKNDDRPGIRNPAIDMEGYLKVAQEAAQYRMSRRLTEDGFLKMSKEDGVIVLDARSNDKYRLLHIKGAINLPFSDISIDSLKRILPDKNAPILIYCNNNFFGNELAFATKSAVASLNLSTYISLYSYGYRNVYELGPQLNPTKSKLSFVSEPTNAQ